MDRMTVCETVDPGSIPGGRTAHRPGGGLRRIGKAATSKVAARKGLGVRVPHPPLNPK